MAISALLSATSAAEPAKGYTRGGFLLLTLVVFAILIIATVVELVQISAGRQAIGHYVNGFAVAYPVFAGFFALIAGAMMAHFFLGLLAKDDILQVFWNRFASWLG